MQTFAERCYRVLSKVPAGKVTTYREIAHQLNSKAYRAVGTAMARNPNAPEVPCHRVICTSGKIGQYAGGSKKKIAMLKAEGIDIQQGKVKEVAKYLHRF